MKVLNEVTDPSKHPNYLDFLNDTLIGTDAKEVTIKCSAMVARFMGEQKYYQGFAEQKRLGNGEVEMKFVPPHYDYFARWLMSYGKEITILSPSELQGIAATLAKELLVHHSAVFMKSDS